MIRGAIFGRSRTLSRAWRSLMSDPLPFLIRLRVIMINWQTLGLWFLSWMVAALTLDFLICPTCYWSCHFWTCRWSLFHFTNVTSHTIHLLQDMIDLSEETWHKPPSSLLNRETNIKTVIISESGEHDGSSDSLELNNQRTTVGSSDIQRDRLST